MRSRLISAAEDIIREHGYGYLTSRTLADRLSLKRQILHYYFESIDDLLVNVVRAVHERAVEAFTAATRSENPLRAIWDMSNDRRMAVLALELAALAARRPAVREEVRKSAEMVRKLQTQILADHLASKGLEPRIDPEFATIILSSLSQTMVQEEMIGILQGHDKVHGIVDHALGEFDQTRKSSYFP